jgi:AraC family transcriptional regulator of adaptative response / DNA-3-methyladenine glycosylase II
VPGAWDGFETAVRAILGQQVSVARATTLAEILAERYGGGAFPTPEALVDADVAAIGMPGQRGAAIRELARAITDGRLLLDEDGDAESLTAKLTGLKGIGPWTAGYIGMRVGRDPDAFVDSDWVVLKVLDTTAAQARKLAQSWRPWRAYAVMYLWRKAQLMRDTAAVKKPSALPAAGG